MPTDPTIADGPVTETKPAPDYRAALEALVIAALTHARKVLHGQ